MNLSRCDSCMHTCVVLLQPPNCMYFNCSSALLPQCSGLDRGLDVAPSRGKSSWCWDLLLLNPTPADLFLNHQTLLSPVTSLEAAKQTSHSWAAGRAIKYFPPIHITYAFGPENTVTHNKTSGYYFALCLHPQCNKTVLWQSQACCMLRVCSDAPEDTSDLWILWLYELVMMLLSGLATAFETACFFIVLAVQLMTSKPHNNLSLKKRQSCCCFLSRRRMSEK